MINLFEREALPQMDALYSFALKLCRDEHHSKDLVQDTMLKAYRYFHTYTEGTNCRAWLFQICKNSYINQYRRKQYEPILLDFQGSAASFSGDRAGAGMEVVEFDDDRSASTHERLIGDEIFEALQDIPADYQTAIMLSDIEGFTYGEIAAFTSVPIGTVRSRIHRGRKMLADRLAAYAHQRGYRAIYHNN